MNNSIVLESIVNISNVLISSNKDVESVENFKKIIESYGDVTGKEELVDIKSAKEECFEILNDMVETELINDDIKEELCNAFNLGNAAKKLSCRECVVLAGLKYMQGESDNEAEKMLDAINGIFVNKRYISNLNNVEAALKEEGILNEEEVTLETLLNLMSEIPTEKANNIDGYMYLDIDNPICYAFKKALSYCVMDQKKKRFMKFEKVIKEINEEIEIEEIVSQLEIFTILSEDFDTVSSTKGAELISSTNTNIEASKCTENVGNELLLVKKENMYVEVVAEELPKRGGEFDAIGANFKIGKSERLVYDRKNLKILGKVFVDGELHFTNSVIEIEEEINLTGKLSFENCDIIFKKVPKNGAVTTYFINSEQARDGICDEVELNIIKCDVRHEGGPLNISGFLGTINLERVSKTTINRSKFTNTKKLLSVGQYSKVEIEDSSFALNEGYIIKCTNAKTINIKNTVIKNCKGDNKGASLNGLAGLMSYSKAAPILSILATDTSFEGLKIENSEGFLMSTTSKFIEMKNCEMKNCEIEGEGIGDLRGYAFKLCGKKLIENCKFINMDTGLILDGETLVKNTVFEEIKHSYALQLSGDNNEASKVSNCSFTNSLAGIDFDNYANGYIENCEFNGLNKNGAYDAYAVLVRICYNDSIVKMNDCKFINCGDEDEILDYECTYSGRFGKSISFDAMEIENCTFI